MNTPNINAENLELPPGHRWVDIANEEPRTDAKIWLPGSKEWVLGSAIGSAWTRHWSYCVPVSATPEPAIPGPAQQIDAIMKRIRSGPKPDLAADTFAHADRLDLLVAELSQLGRAFQATGNDRVAEHLCRIALDLSAEATVSRNFTKMEGLR